MSITPQKKSTHKFIIDPSVKENKKGEQRVPVELNVNKDLLPNQHTLEQLQKVASDPHIFKKVAALTDVHPKKGRRNPTGTAVATKGAFLPQLVDSAPNCGMRMIKTPFGEDDLSKKQIHQLFEELVEVVPTKRYIGTPLSHRTILDVSRRGAAAILETYRRKTNQTENIQQQGNAFEEEKITNRSLFSAIPRLFFRIAQLRLGILGAAGNHFLDLMKIEDVLDEKTAKKFDLKKGQYIFLLHTGSGMFGQYCSYFYMPKKKEHLSQKIITELARFNFLDDKIDWHRQLEEELPYYQEREEFYAIKENSELARNFMIAHRAAANHGFANRTLLQIHIENAMEQILKKKLKNLPLIYDMTHISIRKEEHFQENVWVHRNGTVRSYGPARMKGTKLYQETGEPIFAPSSMSTPAYLGVGTDENQDTFFSASHGTGKSKTKTSEVPESKSELHKKMESQGVRLYNAQSRGILEQDASHYKDIEGGIAGMEENKIMKPVAKMKPVAVLMY
jgi:tRNA-splicing ligase RtcB